MVVSIATRDACDLYRVIRITLDDQHQFVELTYTPSDYMTAVRRAAWYQQEFDPARQSYDYRVAMCD
jgi:hypothetical protein